MTITFSTENKFLKDFGIMKSKETKIQILTIFIKIKLFTKVLNR